MWGGILGGVYCKILAGVCGDILRQLWSPYSQSSEAWEFYKHSCFGPKTARICWKFEQMYLNNEFVTNTSRDSNQISQISDLVFGPVTQ